MPRHQIERVRHDTRRRVLTVEAIEQLSPLMRRITLRSPELHDFVSASPDDHIKLFFPTGDEGPDERPPMRDFTPRAFDTVAGTLVIDFALHDAGPATRWATEARPGDTLHIGGPRGSAVIPDDFDWYLLIGDETALPAIGRRVEGLRAGVPVTTLVAVASAEEAQHFGTLAAWTPAWAVRDERDDAELLIERFDQLARPEGDGFVWIAAESGVVRAVRAHVLDALGHPREWIKAAGYWTRGEAGAQGRIRDEETTPA